MEAPQSVPSDPALAKALALIAAHREARRRPPATPPPPPEEKPLPGNPSLEEIGFGPGMRIRLGQLGLHTVGDLAAAEAARLRLALGEISRLVDVEAWIGSARAMVRTMAGER